MSDKIGVVFSAPVDPAGMVHHRITHLIAQAHNRYGAPDSPIDFRYQIHTSRPSTSTRNMQCGEFLRETDADYLIFCDADAMPDIDSLDLLIQGIQRPDVDVLFGWSVMMRDDGPIPNVTKVANDKGEAALSLEAVHAESGLVEITGGGCGSHCMVVTRDVVQRFYDEETLWMEDSFHRKWGHAAPPAEHGTRDRGHDYWFCHRAAALGFRLWVDNRVYWGHAKAIDLRQWYDQVMHLRHSVHASLDVIAELRGRLGNEAYTAAPELLLRLALEAKRLPESALVVECGSGLSSGVLMRCHCPERVVSLEEDETGLAPLPGAPEIDWYPREHWDSLEDIRLLFVDGPRGTTRGGRAGVMQLRARMAPGGVAIFDDVNRPADREVAEMWSEMRPCDVQEIRCRDGRAFAVVRDRA